MQDDTQPAEPVAVQLKPAEPYCQAQVGGVECGVPVNSWGQQCKRHGVPMLPETARAIDMVVVPVPTPKPMGRPTVMTQEVLRKLEAAFGYGATDKQACFYAGVGLTAFYEYCKDNPDFAEWKEQLKENPIMMARQSVVDALKGDPSLAFKYLERKQKDEFSGRTEVTGADGAPLVEDTDELADILKELKRVGIAAAEQASTDGTVEPNPPVADSQGNGETNSTPLL